MCGFFVVATTFYCDVQQNVQHQKMKTKRRRRQKFTTSFAGTEMCCPPAKSHTHHTKQQQQQQQHVEHDRNEENFVFFHARLGYVWGLMGWVVGGSRIQCSLKKKRSRNCRPNNLMYSPVRTCLHTIIRMERRVDFSRKTHTHTRARFCAPASQHTRTRCGWVSLHHTRVYVFSCRLTHLLPSPLIAPHMTESSIFHSLVHSLIVEHRRRAACCVCTASSLSLTFLVVQPEGFLQLLLEGLVVHLFVEVQRHTAERLEVQLAGVCAEWKTMPVSWMRGAGVVRKNYEYRCGWMLWCNGIWWQNTFNITWKIKLMLWYILQTIYKPMMGYNGNIVLCEHNNILLESKVFSIFNIWRNKLNTFYNYIFRIKNSKYIKYVFKCIRVFLPKFFSFRSSTVAHQSEHTITTNHVEHAQTNLWNIWFIGDASIFLSLLFRPIQNSTKRYILRGVIGVTSTRQIVWCTFVALIVYCLGDIDIYKDTS